MYTKDKDLEQLQNEFDESNNNNEVNNIIGPNINKPKVDIPLISEKEFKTVFPYVSTNNNNSTI